MKTARILAAALLIVAGGLALRVARSQQAAIKRTELQRHDLSIPGREAIQVRGDFPAGAAVPRHTHPGEEISYVMEGEGEILIEGQPALKVKAGDGFIVPNGAKHDARNTGTQTMKLAAIYVVEKGKPLATPAP